MPHEQKMRLIGCGRGRSTVGYKPKDVGKKVVVPVLYEEPERWVLPDGDKGIAMSILNDKELFDYLKDFPVYSLEFHNPQRDGEKPSLVYRIAGSDTFHIVQPSTFTEVNYDPALHRSDAVEVMWCGTHDFDLKAVPDLLKHIVITGLRYGHQTHAQIRRCEVKGLRNPIGHFESEYWMACDSLINHLDQMPMHTGFLRVYLGKSREQRNPGTASQHRDAQRKKWRL